MNKKSQKQAGPPRQTLSSVALFLKKEIQAAEREAREYAKVLDAALENPEPWRNTVALASAVNLANAKGRVQAYRSAYRLVFKLRAEKAGIKR